VTRFAWDGRVFPCMFVSLWTLCTLILAAPARATINYEISFAHPEQHNFRVKVTVPIKDPDVIVALPAWNALYQVRDFSYRVQGSENAIVAVRSQGVELPVNKLDKQTWRLCGCTSFTNQQAVVSFNYEILWDDPGPFNSQLNGHHSFLNLAEILMYVPDRRAEDVEVAFKDVPADWKLITELPAGPNPDSFTASSYDALVDAPVEAGKFVEFDFDSGGAHFRVAVDAREWKKSTLEDSLRRITASELHLMGGPPFKEYTFIFHIGAYSDAGGGGMEHANSTAIGASSQEAAVAIAAHEFFHAWNVKRIRPQSLEPVDYTKEQYTRALWFAEGVTSTYGSYTLERSGIWSKGQFLNDLAEQVCTLDSRPARLWQSVEESSLDTWFDKYDAYNRPDHSISYYNKGQILGVMLDLSIRDTTDNHMSLDDVLRRMNEDYAKQGKFYNDSEGVRTAVEEISGKGYSEFFQHYVSGVSEIPYNDFLGVAGLQLKKESHVSADLGFWPGHAPSGIAVSAVEPGSNAEAAGVQVGDMLLKGNGEEISRNLIRSLVPGQSVKLRIRRDGEEREISYVLGSREDHHCTISDLPGVSPRQLRIRKGLIRESTN
jgi:predicted metalloprotease with PDZ domain